MTPPTTLPSRPGAASSQEVSLALATQAWIILTGLATQSLLARLLAPEGRGAFAVCVMFGSIFGVLFTPGADRGTQYFVMAGRHSLSRGVFIGLALSLAGSLLAIGLALPLIASPLAFFHKADADSFRVGLPLIPLSVILTVLQLQLAGLRRFRQLAVITVLQSVAYVAAIVALVWVPAGGVNGALIAMMASHAFAIGLIMMDLRRHAGLRFERPSLADVREVLGYGRSYYVARIGSTVDLQLGGVFLAMLAAPVEIGLFSAATGLMLRAFMISDSIEASLLPRVAADPEGRPQLVGQCARLSGLATGAAVVGLVVLSAPIVHVLLSDAFLPTIPLLWILAPGVMLYAGSKVLMAYFRGRNQPGICSWVVWTGLCVNIGALIVLYPLIGMPAAAWAMTLGFASRSLILAIAFRRVSGVRPGSTWRLRRDDLAMLLRSGRELAGRLSVRRDRLTHV